MLRVLQIVIAPNSWGSKSICITGPERRAANIINLWKREKIEVVVCYPQRGNLWEQFVKADIPVIDFEIVTKYNFYAILKILRIAKKYNIEIVHSQGPPSLDLIACIAGKIAHVPVIITRPVMIEDQVTYSKICRFVYAFIDRIFTLKVAKSVVAVSRSGYEHLLSKCGVNASKLELIRNGIKLNKFTPQKASLSTGQAQEDPVIIGMVAQLFPPKGWFDFIDVVGNLKRKGMNIKGLIVGEGILRDELMKKVLSNGLDKLIEFAGFQNDVQLVLGRMDIFLFTSYREGLSVAIIEAMAMGLPIVATDVGGIHEQVVEKLNGFIVSPGDISNMVQKCEELIRHPELRSSMGKQSRIIAKNKYSEERMLLQYTATYRKSFLNVAHADMTAAKS